MYMWGYNDLYKNIDNEGSIYSEVPLLLLIVDLAIISINYNTSIPKDGSNSKLISK